MSFFDNINNIREGECKLSEDKKVLQVWTDGKWVIYKAHTVIDGRYITSNPPCNDIVNNRHFVFDNNTLEWIEVAGLKAAAGYIYAPYILADTVQTIGNGAPSTLIQSRYASSQQVHLANYFTWDISTI